MITNKIGGVAFAILATLLLAACGDGSKQSEAPKPEQEKNQAQAVETVRAIETQSTATAFVLPGDQQLPRPRPNVVLVNLPANQPALLGPADSAVPADPISQLIGVDGSIEKVGQSLLAATPEQTIAPTPIDTVAIATELEPGGGLAGTEQSVVNQINPASQVTQLLKPVGPGEPTEPGDPIEALVEIGTQHLIKSLTQ